MLGGHFPSGQLLRAQGVQHGKATLVRKLQSNVISLVRWVRVWHVAFPACLGELGAKQLLMLKARCFGM